VKIIGSLMYKLIASVQLVQWIHSFCNILQNFYTTNFDNCNLLLI